MRLVFKAQGGQAGFIALLHEWLVIIELPHAPNHQLPARGTLARGVVIGGLARVVILTLPTTSVVMRLPI